MTSINKDRKQLFKSLILVLISIIIASNSSVQVYAYDQEYYSTNDVLYYDPRDQCIHGSATDPTASSLTTSADATENLKNAFVYFRGKGLSDIQSAAIVGNIAIESRGIPTNSQGSLPDTKDPSVFGTSVGVGKAWGLIQWDAGGRAIEYAKTAKITGPIYELGTQLDLIYWHMTDTSPTGKKNMLKGWVGSHAATIPAAVAYFEHTVEGAGKPALSAREKAAEAALKNFSNAPSTLPTSSTLPNGNSCTCATPSLTLGANTIVLDPGHTKGGKFKDTDPETGLRVGDYSNGQEDKDAWEVAQKVQQKLSDIGYTVILTKDAVDSYTNLKMRADVANKANAALAVSIHTTGGNFVDSDSSKSNPNWVTPQKMNGWREGEKGKLTFTDQALADKSKKYADIIANARAKAIGGSARVITNYFETGNFDRKDFSPGDIPITQLLSKVPWVYNEAGQKGIDINKYADGLAEGIKTAIPLVGASSTPGSTSATDYSSGCDSATGLADTSSLAATIRSYTYPDYKGKGFTTPLPAYAEATKVAARAGLWIGNNGIDCGGYVTRLMQNSKLDTDYNNLPGMKGDTAAQGRYLRKSGKYTRLHPKDTSELRLGDIAITPGKGHTYMWVGKLEGINSTSVSASNGTRAPMADSKAYASLSVSYNGQLYEWYRLSKP